VIVSAQTYSCPGCTRSYTVAVAVVVVLQPDMLATPPNSISAFICSRLNQVLLVCTCYMARKQCSCWLLINCQQCWLLDACILRPLGSAVHLLKTTCV
jgi:hypothetical protein